MVVSGSLKGQSQMGQMGLSFSPGTGSHLVKSCSHSFKTMPEPAMPASRYSSPPSNSITANMFDFAL